MRHPQGYICIADPEAGVDEIDTFTCRHCQRIVPVRARQNPAALGGFCRTCDALICGKCVGGSCVPFMRQVERMEEAYYRRRQRERL